MIDLPFIVIRLMNDGLIMSRDWVFTVNRDDEHRNSLHDYSVMLFFQQKANWYNL